MTRPEYRGRFAPSPTGALHPGSVVAALASWLDARAHQGRWLLRIEDTDTPRVVPGADQWILNQLQRLGLQPDEPVQWQSRRQPLYQAALTQLIEQGDGYACICSRRDVERALQAQGMTRPRHQAAVYPGTCRAGLGMSSHAARAWRCRVPPPGDPDTNGLLRWQDRRLGPQAQDLSRDVGDFIVRRADGCWAYQLAVVVDDADQGITHVVRGEDLCDNTARQIHLQQRLGRPTPLYLHTPLVRAADGQKLSKQNGAVAVDVSDPLRALQAAASVLGLDVAPERGTSVPNWLDAAIVAWARRYGPEAKPTATPSA